MDKVSEVRPSACLPLIQFLIVLSSAALGLCCLEDVHPGTCTCTPFGRNQTRVKCSGITQVPDDLPSNTVQL